MLPLISGNEVEDEPGTSSDDYHRLPRPFLLPQPVDPAWPWGVCGNSSTSRSRLRKNMKRRVDHLSSGDVRFLIYLPFKIISPTNLQLSPAARRRGTRGRLARRGGASRKNSDAAGAHRRPNSNPDSDGGEEGFQQAHLALRLSLVVRVRDEERLLQVDALAKGDAAPDRGLRQRQVGRRRRARHRLLGGHEPRGEGAEASLMLPPQCERASSAVVSPSVRAASASARAALGQGAGKSPLLSVKSARRGGSSSSGAESGKERRLSGVAA